MGEHNGLMAPSSACHSNGQQMLSTIQKQLLPTPMSVKYESTPTKFLFNKAINRFGQNWKGL